jgi:DNA invertase Pin-like site-specific DNA recombinase
VSLDAQRRALAELAQAKNLPIIGEYADAVESGKDDQRPGYQRLLRDLSARGRAWNVILAYDTSRIARRTYIAQSLQHEAKKRGVSILYVRIPESDPITSVILQNTFQAMDEVHSLMSREKGLAGMAENVRRGFRAGGRAPIGYRFERVATAAVRNGAAVEKSRLVPDEALAPAIATYLRARSAGQAGSAIARQLRLPITRTGLVDVEWNALTYAGHTTWNTRRPKDSQASGSRRPRSEWQIQRGTHQALVSDAEAEAILTRLEKGAHAARRNRGGTYLLSGLLVRPDGKPWWGDRDCYTTRGGSIDAALLERSVLEQLPVDLGSPEIVQAFVREIRALQENLQDRSELEAARAALADVEKRIRKLMGLVEHAREPRPLLARLDELEIERQDAAERVMRAEDAGERVKVLEAVDEAAVAALLQRMASDMGELDRDALKDVLRAWIGRIELDPATRSGRITYRLTLSRVKVASPQGQDANPDKFWADGAELVVPRLRLRRPPGTICQHKGRTTP